MKLEACFVLNAPGLFVWRCEAGDGRQCSDATIGGAQARAGPGTQANALGQNRTYQVKERCSVRFIQGANNEDDSSSMIICKLD
jgi:hypothetical protein